MRASSKFLGAAAVAVGTTLALTGCFSFSASQPVRLDGRDIVATEDIDTAIDTAAANNVDVLDMRLGDCLYSPTGDGGTVSSLSVVPCDTPHEDEVYYVFALEDGPFPGDDMDDIVWDVCTAEFERFIDIDWNKSDLEWWPLVPTQQSWNGGDRDVLCMAYALSGELITGSLAGAQR